MLVQLEKDEMDTAQFDALFAQKIRDEITACESKLDTLLDAHLEQAISRDEYTTKKNKVLSQKMDLEQKLKEFERKGNAWLERARAFIKASHQAEYVALAENLFAKKDFLKLCGSNRLLAGRKAAVDFQAPWSFVFEFKEKLDFGRAGVIKQNASEGGDFANFKFILGD